MSAGASRMTPQAEQRVSDEERARFMLLAIFAHGHNHEVAVNIAKREFAAVADAARREEREACARVAAEQWPRGSAHTYASENADRYVALEDASETIAAAIRARGEKGAE